jgi:hypothetical protein
MICTSHQILFFDEDKKNQIGGVKGKLGGGECEVW